MLDPKGSGYYWIRSTHWDYKTQTNSLVWEVAFWEGVEQMWGGWMVTGKEYNMTSKELGIVEWQGPLEQPKE